MQNRQSGARTLAVMAGAALFTAAMLARPVLAVEDSGQRFPPPTTTADPKGQKGQKQQGQKKKKQNQSELREQYQNARALIMSGQYEAGIAAMRALDHD